MAKKPEHELIIVPLDGSDQAEQVIPYAEALRDPGGTLIFFQVVYPSGPARGIFGDVEFTMEQIVQQERDEAKQRLHEIADRWDPVLAKKPVVESFAGDTVGAIEALARDRSATMLAITSSGRGALSRFAFGSVADSLIRQSPVPVLIVHADGHAEPKIEPVELKRIIVPLDGSEIAEAALPAAGRIANDTRLPVVLLQVINPSLEFSMVGQGIGPITGDLYNEVESDFTAQANEELDRGSKLLGPVESGVTLTVLEGGVTEAIQSYVEPGDLIVMTSHGRTGMRRFILGSVAQKIINERIAPVVLVPAPADLLKEGK